MQNWLILVFFLAINYHPLPSQCQGMMEFGNSQAMSTGLGAGIAATYGSRNQAVKNSYQSILKAHNAALEQTKAIEKYMQYGCKLQSQKRWAEAEGAFHYVLQVISRRDGPGSNKSLPALEHLVLVTEAQNRLNDAINYQETVVAFKKAEKNPDPSEVVTEQVNLGNLCVRNNDYRGAASVLHETVSYCESHKTLPAAIKRSTRFSYAKVLRQLHKDKEAELVELSTDKDDENDRSTDKFQ